MPVAINGDTETEAIELAGFSGKVQASTPEASSEIWFCALDCVGTAGVDCGLGAGFVAQQAIRPQQSTQLPIAGFMQAGDAGMDTYCASTRTRMNNMANDFFTILLCLTLKGLRVKSLKRKKPEPFNPGFEKLLSSTLSRG